MQTDDRPMVHFLFEPGNGGLDRVAILLANGMAARGVPAELWLSKREGPVASLISDQVTVRMVPTVSFGGRGLKLFMQIPALAKMIRKYRPKAMFSAGNQSNLNIALAKKMAGVAGASTKIVQKITNPIVRPGMAGFRGSLRTFRFGKTAELGDVCLTLSEPDARAYAEMMPSVGEKFQAVRNAYVNEAMLARGETPRSRQEGMECNLLSVGRLEYQKDHTTLIRALARIKDMPWQMRILGNGSLEEQARALAEQLGIADRIIFEGFVDDPTEAYARSDIMILSSRWEGLPAAPLEAMAAGCDVVTTDCSEGLTDILAGLGRPVVPIEDDAALATAIADAIRSGERPAGMRQIAESYSIASSVEDHLRIAGHQF